MKMENKEKKDRKLSGYYNVTRFPIPFNDRWFSYERIKGFLSIFESIFNNHRLSKPIPIELQREYTEARADFQYFQYKKFREEDNKLARRQEHLEKV